MPAPKLSVAQDADGGASLVGVVGGVEVVFARVNPSEVAAAAAAQGVEWTPPTVSDDTESEG